MGFDTVQSCMKLYGRFPSETQSDKLKADLKHRLNPISWLKRVERISFNEKFGNLINFLFLKIVSKLLIERELRERGTTDSVHRNSLDRFLVDLNWEFTIFFSKAWLKYSESEFKSKAVLRSRNLASASKLKELKWFEVQIIWTNSW